MDKPISVGDLVMVVRPKPCCGTGETLGHVFRVGSIYRGDYDCDCGASEHGVLAREGKDFDGWEVCRLKRIDPLAELEGEKRDEEITA